MRKSMRPCSTADASPPARSRRGFTRRRASDQDAARTVRATAQGSPDHRNSARNPILRPSLRLSATLRAGTNGTARRRLPAPPLSCAARRPSSPGRGSCGVYVKRDPISALCRTPAQQLFAPMVARPDTNNYFTLAAVLGRAALRGESARAGRSVRWRAQRSRRTPRSAGTRSRGNEPPFQRIFCSAVPLCMAI